MKRRVNRHIAWLLGVLLIGVGCLSGCGGAREQEILVLHAGSLSIAFRDIVAAYEESNPGTRVVLEAVGSKAGARKLTDLGRRCDVFVSADAHLIDTLLIPSHASWNISFARNALCLAYRERSIRGEEITAENFLDVLTDERVRFGRCDPNSAPCGYRTLHALMLAEEQNGRAGAVDRILNRGTRYLRPKESDLLALLETGSVDYAMVYRSTAIQRGLKYVELPDAINLSDPALAESYGAARVEVAGNHPDEVAVEVGRPIVYGVTIPEDAPQPAAALKFVAFMLAEDQGMAIIERSGLIPAVPSATRTYANVPGALKPYAAAVPSDEGS